VCPVLTGSGVRGKILEAMAMKIPVVSTTIGSEGIPVDQGSNAFLADSPEVMAGCIQLLLGDEAKRKQMGERARHAVETHFDWDTSMDDLERVLHDVVSKRSYNNVA
jgi:polysaccharide biosynthesis protein PslH